MKAKLAKAVGAQFSVRLREELPQFQERMEPWHWRLYSWQVSEDLHFFLYLIFFKGRNTFNIEVAWSKKGRYPLDILTLLPSQDPIDGELRFSLSRLWEPSVGEPSYWELEREPTLGELEKAIVRREKIPRESDDIVMSRIDSKVEDAVNKVVRYAVPYFKTVAAEHGIDLKE